MIDSKFKSILHIIIGCLFSLSIITILLSITCFNSIQNINKVNIDILILIIGIIIFIFFSYLIICFVNPKNNKMIYLISIIVFITQLLFIYNYFFYTGWDADYIYQFSSHMAHKDYVYDVSYFSMCPNNLFLVFIYKYLILLIHNIGFHGYEHAFLIVVNVVLSNLAGILLYKSVNKLFNKSSYAYLAYFIYLLLVLLSPWISIPYSDTLALIFPISMFYIYISYSNNLKYFFISLISLIAYNLKPQSFVFFIVFIIFYFFDLISGKIKKISLLFTILGILFSFLITNYGINNIKEQTSEYESIIKSEDRFGIAHYLMMGLNNNGGTYNYDDVIFSSSFDSKKQRDIANYQEAIKRLKTINLPIHIIKKTLINYNDGSFAWGKEGNVYTEIVDKKNNTLSPFLRNIYYDTGKYNNIFSSVVYGIWILTLICCGFSLKGVNKEKDMLMLSFFGLFLFVTLFEARARYLFSNVPLIIILAIYGLDNIYNKVNKKDKYFD